MTVKASTCVCCSHEQSNMEDCPSTQHKHSESTHCLIAKTIAGSISVVYFSLCFLDLWYNEILTGATEILRGKVRWEEGGRWSDIPDILWFSVYLSLFDLNETTGCRTDPACELDEATLHTSSRNTRRAYSCSTPVVDAICERELVKRTVMVQFIINHIWFARLPKTWGRKIWVCWDLFFFSLSIKYLWSLMDI